MQSMEIMAPLSYLTSTFRSRGPRAGMRVFIAGGVDIVLTADLFHCILLYRLNHLIVPQGGPDGGLLFGRTLRDDGILVFRVVVALSDGQTALALDLGDVEAGDLEAVTGFHKCFQLLVGCRGLCGGQCKVRIGQLHLDLVVRPVLAQKNDA